mmetsp:Transcript_43281/g.72998  ORF Transcript_43281/g.72998 Transcript_43281/m.72998 type:complete len:215 (-) Transcript_43281:219-863(-)
MSQHWSNAWGSEVSRVVLGGGGYGVCAGHRIHSLFWMSTVCGSSGMPWGFRTNTRKAWPSIVAFTSSDRTPGGTMIVREKYVEAEMTGPDSSPPASCLCQALMSSCWPLRSTFTFSVSMPAKLHVTTISVSFSSTCTVGDFKRLHMETSASSASVSSELSSDSRWRRKASNSRSIRSINARDNRNGSNTTASTSFSCFWNSSSMRRWRCMNLSV